LAPAVVGTAASDSSNIRAVGVRFIAYRACDARSVVCRQHSSLFLTSRLRMRGIVNFG
jgi:hypothetical protein